MENEAWITSDFSNQKAESKDKTLEFHFIMYEIYSEDICGSIGSSYQNVDRSRANILPTLKSLVIDRAVSALIGQCLSLQMVQQCKFLP